MFQTNAIEQMIGSTALTPEKKEKKIGFWKKTKRMFLSLYIQWGGKPTCLLLHKPCIDYMNDGIDIMEQSLMFRIQWFNRFTEMETLIVIVGINDVGQMKTNKAA